MDGLSKNTGQRPTAFREARTLNILRFRLNILTDHSARSSRDGVPNDGAEATRRPSSMFANMWDITTLAVTFVGLSFFIAPAVLCAQPQAFQGAGPAIASNVERCTARRRDDDHQAIMGSGPCSFEPVRMDGSPLLQTIDPYLTRDSRQAVRAGRYVECTHPEVNGVSRVGFVLRLPSGTIRADPETRDQPRLRDKSALGSVCLLRCRNQRLCRIKPVPVQRGVRPYVVSAKGQIGSARLPGPRPLEATRRAPWLV
jgi:hypothetical protein